MKLDSDDLRAIANVLGQELAEIRGDAQAAHRDPGRSHSRDGRLRQASEPVVG